MHLCFMYKLQTITIDINMRLKFWRKPTPSDKKDQEKKSKTREWLDSILFAVVAATIIRWLVMSAYTIPTPSMEGSQLVGDFLFVSKFHYGARTPNTLLHLPLTHNTIWGTNIPSYLSWLQLPTYRLPGFSQVKRNDVVVFNLPADTIARPVDMRTNYVKRCVAIAGDTLEVRNANLYINHQRSIDPKKLQYRYELITSIPISDRVFGRYNVYFGGENSNLRYTTNNGQYAYYIYITPANVLKLKTQLNTTLLSLKMLKQEKDVSSEEMYPSSYWRDQNKKKGASYAIAGIRWSVDYFGPLVIPKKDMRIAMTRDNIIKYAPIIKEYEYHQKVSVATDFSSISIDGKFIKSYTFRQNYYFMMGDNRHNSIDSRYWGLVPQDHILGKAWFTWLSLNPNRGWLDGKIRWDRFFKGI